MSKVNKKDVGAYAEAYKSIREKGFDLQMKCGKCGGELKVHPFVSEAYFKTNGMLHFNFTTINYCPDCYK